MEAERVALRIFDLIDAHQISQAEGALETALQRYPQDECLRAAEALIIMRSGNTSLAKDKAIVLSEKGITKPKAVNALVHVLQNCCCWEALAATYERLKPLQNERQTSENLVQTYVRMGAYAKVQQTATQLYRQHGDVRYQVWMLQAMLAQVPAGSTDHMLLTLATKLLDVAVLQEKGLLTPSTVLTYVDLLAQQGLYANAVDFLLSERSAKIGLLATRLETLARMLQKAGRVGAANAVARHLWSLDSDNWTPFAIYKETLAPAGADEATILEVHGPSPETSATIDCSTANHSFEEALGLAQALQAVEESKHPNKLRRGPYLAELDLLHKQQSPALPERMRAYAERFYRKPCCYLDLSVFLTPESAASTYEWSRASASDLADALDGHTRHILGLRCLVGSWDQPPRAEVLEGLFQECVDAYRESRHLSKDLAWSEEGLCDGYITVALNIALRGYVARDRACDTSYLIRGLDLMGIVDRRTNNPTWLLYAVCFANLLGLTDCAAAHQLAFKNVQRDTMAHVGYWPLFTGLALEDIAEWESWAEDHYSHLERDCSLLRAKVFNFTSWPAMKDVQHFEAVQANSLYRWQSPANEYAAALLEVQTQKDVVESFETRTVALWEAWQHLSLPKAEENMADNTDWVVAKALVLGDIHSAKVRHLTECLVSVPSREWQLRRNRQLLASIFLLHDVAAVYAHRVAAKHTAASRKGKVQRGCDAPKPPPTLYMNRLEGQSTSVEFLPAVQPLAPVLRSYVDSLGKAAPKADAASSAFRAHLQTLVADPQQSAADFEAFIYPEVYLISALFKVMPTTELPVKVWTTEMWETLEAAQHRYESRTWSLRRTPVEQDGSTSTTARCTLLDEDSCCSESYTAKLVQEKVRRVVGYVSALKTEMAFHTR